MRLAGILVVLRNQGQASWLAAGHTASPSCVHVLVLVRARVACTCWCWWMLGLGLQVQRPP